jgi:hypothetical protein
MVEEIKFRRNTMYELKLYDVSYKYIGTFRCKDLDYAKQMFNDFVSGYLSVELFDPKGELLDKQTVLQ